MIPAIILATLRQRFTSPMRLVILVAAVWISLIPVLVSPGSGFAMIGDCYFLALALAAGMIGEDVSSGTLQLLLARPVTRRQYVFSKWVAVAGGTSLVVVAQLLLAALVIALRGASVSWGGAALLLANDVLLAFGISAVMSLLSALVPGLGDLGLLFLAFLSTQVLGGLGSLKSWGALERATQELQRVLKPELNVWPLLHGDPASPAAVASYLSTVTLCLALAVMVMNRKELSYVSAGG